jgi:hypothetical protein
VKLPDNPVTYSFMFRVVGAERWVNANDSTLHEPNVSDATRKKFEKARAAKPFETDHYKKNQRAIQAAMTSAFERYDY